MKTEKTNAAAGRDETAGMTATVTELQREGFGQMAWMSAAMVETLTALGNEVMQFVATRIAEDVKAQHAMLNCRGDLAKMQQIQADFMRDALAQYSAETGKLLELGSGVMTAALPKRGKDAGPV